MNLAETVELADGRRMPRIGLGVWEIPPERIRSALAAAIECGYRSFDTAANYGNEADVGAAVRESRIDRSEFFVTTKLWNAEQGYDSTLRACEGSLSRLGLDFVDLYLIHWPMPERGLYLDTWRAFERLQREGMVRSVGVSNFLVENLETLRQETGVQPVVNQIELHPLLQQAELREYHSNHGIVTAAWSPFAVGRALADPVVRTIAHRLGRTPAQVIVRWHLQLGNVVLPRSSAAARIAENARIDDFELGAADMAAIRERNSDIRVGADPRLVN
jgi:diketogulonate reductase-like aldo/keto reductase